MNTPQPNPQPTDPREATLKLQFEATVKEQLLKGSGYTEEDLEVIDGQTNIIHHIWPYL